MEDIELIIEQHIASMTAHSGSHLYDPIDYILQDGGKRMRPFLALLAGEVMGGDLNDVMPSAVAIEVFHNFTLLHDDIMDNATTRRGRDTVHVKWDSSSAILSGDAMMIMSYDILSRSKPEHICSLLSIFNRAAMEVCQGQQLDMEFESRASVTMAEYINMIRLKTSALMASALALGATASGAGGRERDALYKFGDNLGLAFQIQDDLLDTYGNVATFGKKIGGDIAEGKQTFLRIFTHNCSSEQDRAVLTSSRDYTVIKSLYDKYGAQQGAQEAMGQYFEQAMGCLSIFEASSIQRLMDYSHTLLKRDK